MAVIQSMTPKLPAMMRYASRDRMGRRNERLREDGDRGEEVGGGNGEQHDGGREIRVGGPCHGQLAAPQVQVAVAALDLERVHQHAHNGAAQHDDEQAQARAHPAEPMRPRHDGQLERHAGAQSVPAVGLCLGVQGCAGRPRGVIVWRRRRRRCERRCVCVQVDKTRGRRGGGGGRGREVASSHSPQHGAVCLRDEGEGAAAAVPALRRAQSVVGGVAGPEARCRRSLEEDNGR
jgi:hypothetical protein